MTFVQRILAALLAAILAIFGGGRRAAVASPASAIVAAALADAEAVPEEAAPSRPRSPFEGAELGHSIKDHAAARLGQRAPGLPELAPLPFWLRFWFSELDTTQLKKIASPSIPGWLLQQHVLAGTGGTLPSLGFVTQAPAASKVGTAAGGKDGKSAAGGDRNKPEPINLAAVLDELGYVPARGMRMR